MSSQSTVVMKSKDVRTRDELADLLQSLAERIRSGRVVLNQGATDVELELPASVHVDLEVTDSAKPSRTKRELEIEVWWEIDETGRPVEGQGSSGVTVR